MVLRESQGVEFKESFSDVDGIVTAVVAFANNGGGKLYIGVRDDGSVCGASLGRNTIENLAKAITRGTEPPVLPKIIVEEMEEKTVVVVAVEESRIKPHFFKKIAFKRVGKTNAQMDISEIRQLILEQSRACFEDELVDFDLSELDEGVFKSFLRACVESNRLKVDANSPIHENMEKLDAAKNGRVKLGFVLMFAKNPSKHLPHYGIKLAKVSTDYFTISSLEKSAFYAEPVFKVVETALFEVLDCLPKKTSLQGIRRVEEPVIPSSVVREFLTNALIHADYNIASTISVIVTPTFLEISNPGGLKELKVSDLYKKHKSILRNPLMAKLMFLSGNVEQWGSGIENAIKELVKNGLGLPEFRVENNFFHVRINFSKQKTRAALVISALKTGKKTSKKIASQLKLAERTARKEIQRLADIGIIKREKQGRNVFYKL